MCQLKIGKWTKERKYKEREGIEMQEKPNAMNIKRDRNTNIAKKSVQHVFPHMFHSKNTFILIECVIYLGFMYCKQNQISKVVCHNRLENATALYTLAINTRDIVFAAGAKLESETYEHVKEKKNTSTIWVWKTPTQKNAANSVNV